MSEYAISVVVIDTPSLGDRSYIVHDGSTGVVIDPQRDLDRFLEPIEELGISIGAVLETHIHNDYVTGGFALARELGADYGVHGKDDVAFDRRPLGDGDVIDLGSFAIRSVHTPGHTPTHLAYVVEASGTARHVLTGGGLLYGSVGRTDLIEPARTDELTRAQFRSAHRLRELLADDVAVWPTHGFGSFCSSGQTTGAAQSTIGHEAQSNDAFLAADEDGFTKQLMAGLGAYPSYYAFMAPQNLAGPSGARSVDVPPLEEPTAPNLDDSAAPLVLDLRGRQAFADAHTPGSVNLEFADSASTHAAWTFGYERLRDHPPVVVGDPALIVQQAEALERQFVRIGLSLAGYAPTDVSSNSASYRVGGFADLAGQGPERSSRPTVLDVRRATEFEQGHVAGALHIPLHELPERLAEIPSGPVWVHCASGYRAALAASLLDAQREGDVVLIDDRFSAASVNLL